MFEENIWFPERPPYWWWLYHQTGAVKSQLILSDLKQIWNVELYRQLTLRCEIQIFFLSLEIMSQVSSRTFCFPERTVPCSWKGSLTHHGSSAVKEINPLRSSCKICEPFLETSQCGSSRDLFCCATFKGQLQLWTSLFHVGVHRQAAELESEKVSTWASCFSDWRFLFWLTLNFTKNCWCWRRINNWVKKKETCKGEGERGRKLQSIRSESRPESL